MRIILFMMVFMVNSLIAISLTPLYHTMDDKRELKTMFTVQNSSNRPVAVKFAVLALVDTDNNRESRVASSKVNFYPSQFVLDAKSSKNVRVSYLGKSLPKVEEVYRVVANELNVNVADKKIIKKEDNKISGSLTMRFSYAGLLFVRDASAKAHLKVESFQQLSDGTVEIVIVNNGTASTLMSSKQYSLKVMVNNQLYTLDENDLKNSQFRRILPHKSNRYILKDIQSLPKGTITSIRVEKR